MKLQFKFWKRTITLILNRTTQSFYSFKTPEAETGGITSRCLDGRHVIFLDYDNIERWIVEDELKLLQHKYKLTPFYLFTTQQQPSKISGQYYGNYHAICISKYPVHKVSDIQDNTHIDWRYKKMFAISRYKTWVLRTMAKRNRAPPEYLGVIGFMQNLDNEISTAHLNILQTLYPKIDIVKYTNPDMYVESFVTTYKTAAGVD